MSFKLGSIAKLDLRYIQDDLKYKQVERMALNGATRSQVIMQALGSL